MRTALIDIKSLYGGGGETYVKPGEVLSESFSFGVKKWLNLTDKISLHEPLSK